ncbi:MAG: Txe/YoeB family addiction module toxin [Planctomycetaceae bacterium]|jgi:toxin YoeB|nr:Txe/YoeB family addiction module toxin [Planctomycetaceae bacterium]
MAYQVSLVKDAKRHITEFEQSGNQQLMRKLFALLDELEVNPYIGTGKPERLKGSRSGLWSRRINREHRLVYYVEEAAAAVTVVSARGHYE